MVRGVKFGGSLRRDEKMTMARVYIGSGGGGGVVAGGNGNGTLISIGILLES
jgi:hypothetical protein